MNHRTINNSSC